MPFVSDVRYRRAYVPRADLAARLKDVELLLRTVVAMPLHQQTKKMMLNRILWLVVDLSGGFDCRHRSDGALNQLGTRVQRDHVHPRKGLVEELLGPNPDFESIIQRAHCCLVTHEEHQRLSKAPRSLQGWDRYRHAKVTVHDMLTGRL